MKTLIYCLPNSANSMMDPVKNTEMYLKCTVASCCNVPYLADLAMVFNYCFIFKLKLML